MVKITSLNSEFSIVGLNAEEYPEIPILSEDEKIEISQPLLKKMIRQTAFAVSMSDDKPIFKGILFEMAEDTIKLVSVDGFRLAIKQEKIRNNKIFSFIVPGKALSEIVRLLGDDEEEIAEITVGKRHMNLKSVITM
jgi:DNA polymerase-3 subunit beta